jgi:hypothetical protein
MIRTACAIAVVALVVAAAACSERRGSLSPTGPTSVASQSASSFDRSEITSVIDRTQGAVRDNAVVASWAREHGWSTSGGFVVEGVAEITATSGACPTVTLTVVGIPVTVNGSTLFAPPLTCSGLTVGVTAHIVAMLTVDAGTFSVVALGIELPATVPPSGNTTPPSGNTTPPPGNTTPPSGNTTPPEPPSEHGPKPPVSPTEGSVGALRGTCPNLSFKVKGDDVATTADTTFSPTCSAIRNGSKVAVSGTVSGQTIVASTVTVTR